MSLVVAVIISAFLIRQIDRWWFSARRNPFTPRSGETLEKILDLQRRRANNITPILLVLSVWLEIAGWCLLLSGCGLLAGTVLSLIIGTKFRHLQEITHFAVHGTLAKGKGVGDFLGESCFQAALGMPTVGRRRRTHVREHHPNATLVGLDPNLATLAAGGLKRGLGRKSFVIAIIFPITLAGLARTVREYVHDSLSGTSVKSALLRAGETVSVPAVLYGLSGAEGLLWGYVLPRLAIYPLLAWLSLLVEHRWFNSAPTIGVPLLDEASRCIRLYGSRRTLLFLARITWLPYGDAFHFAHSVHPGVRWNYLEALNGLLRADVAQYQTLLIGRQSALAELYREGACERGSAAC